MRIALAQILSGADPAANLDLIADATAEAAADGARLVVFPEATMRAFGSGRLDEIAEDIDGPWASAVAEIARGHDVVIAAGMFRPAPHGKVFNSLLVTGTAGSNGVSAGDSGSSSDGPDGDGDGNSDRGDGNSDRDLHLAYDKIHLFDAFGFAESDTVAAGDEVRAVQIDGVGVGLTVCYDARFPAQYRTLAADHGAEVIICAASWGAGRGKVDQWRLLNQARALDSTCVVLAVDQADPAAAGVKVRSKAPTGVGHSLVAGPDGTVLAEAEAEPTVLVADIDTEAPEKVRRAIPVLANGRVTE